MSRRSLGIIAIAALALVAGWVLFVGLPRWYGPKPARAAAAQPAPQHAPDAAPERKITATLYYVADNGLSLVPAQREVPYGATTVEQARAIIEAQIAPAAPLVSAIPRATRLRTSS